MNEQCLKLTAYFGERQRAVGGAGRFLADAMLDLFGSHNVATSVMLRGTTSFGPKHEFRCDQSLSLSEDPPVTVAAVDIESKIRSLVDDVTAMTDRGLVTLERARLVTRHSGAEEFGDIDSRNGDAAKLTIYAGRQVRVAGAPAYYTICELLHRHGFAGATVLLGVDGTAHGRRRRARFFGRNVNVPLMIIAVGTPAQVAVAAMELTAALPNPLLTIERVRLCKRDGELFARPQQLPQTDDQGRTLWQKLMVHTAEATHHEGLPIHRALVHRLMQSETARGATALRGIWGFYGDHKPHGDKLFQLVRRVPVTTIIVDTPQAIARSFDIVDELTNWHGLVTSEMVPAAVSLTVDERVVHLEQDRDPAALDAVDDVALPHRVAPPWMSAQGADRPRRTLATVSRRAQLQGQLQGMIKGLTKLPSGLFGVSADAADLGAQALSLKARKASLPFTARRTLFNNTAKSAARAYGNVELPLADVKALAKATGTSVNDVVMTVIDDALHHYLAEHQASTDRPLVAFMPMSLREKSGEGGGNRVSAELVPMGAPKASPVERLKEINAATTRAKDKGRGMQTTSRQAYALLLLGSLTVADALPLLGKLPSANVVISNMKGPTEQLYLAGAPLVAFSGLPIVPPGAGLNVTFASINTALCIAIGAAPEAVHEPSRLAELMQRAFTELQTEAGTTSPTTSKSRTP